MTSSFLLKATAVAMVVVAVLAATAEAAIPATIATRDFLFSPISLWVAANAIIVWLVVSSSRRGRAANDDDPTASSSAAAHDNGEVSMDSLYTSSSEYEAFSDAGSSAHRAFDPPVSSRLPREARAARKKADRPRVRKKPAAHQVAPSPRAVPAAEEEVKPARPVVVDEEEDVSMDSLWESIVQRRAARPVVVQKSESWGNDELPRLERVAETARRTEMRKAASAVSDKAKAAAEKEKAAVVAPTAAQRLGWRTREVLVAITPDELLRRAESFIRRQHEHLRLQRQESEQRQLQLQLQRRLHAGPAHLIRV